jgi:hypothetical protein
VNFEKRQVYICYKHFEWYPKHLYKKYASLIGSATANNAKANSMINRDNGVVAHPCF